jgi:hypothetical protein
MTLESTVGGACAPPFPVYAHLADDLMAAHHADNCERDETVAHVLATCGCVRIFGGGYRRMMMTRLGLDANGCVRAALDGPEVGSESSTMTLEDSAPAFRVHAGFRRNTCQRPPFPVFYRPCSVASTFACCSLLNVVRSTVPP